MLFLYFLVFVLGLTFGSFLTSYTYRWPRNLSFGGRSYCDNCRKKISWYDNIPLLSYFLLSGKCRNCQQKISFLYPLIEFVMGIMFIAIFYVFMRCPYVQGTSLDISIICSIKSTLGVYTLPYLFAVCVSLIAIFIIDLQTQYIPDELVFFILTLSLLVLIITANDSFYLTLFAAFFASTFFLFLNFITHGKGMGLGDVKLVLAGGLFFGMPFTISWLFLSFILGAVIGLTLIYFGKAKFKKPIAFGPFLVMSWFITMFWGDKLVSILIPWF